MDASWKEHRHEVFAAQERALADAARAEHEAATALIRSAIAAYRTAGIEPYPLRARPYRGSRSVATTHTGWYLKVDRTVGIDTKGQYFVLSAPGDLVTRLRKATLKPTDAPLVVGRGGRDGEAIALQELLDLRLQEPVVPSRGRA